MSDNRLVTVARYDTRGDAQVAKTRLEEAEIPCLLANAEQSGLSMLFDGSSAGVQLKVRESHLEAARELLGSERGED